MGSWHRQVAAPGASLHVTLAQGPPATLLRLAAEVLTLQVQYVVACGAENY